MKYCTRCGRKLTSTGDCPYCTNLYYGRRSRPMIRAVTEACNSYPALALACFWTISILSLLVFSVLTLNPLVLVALPGVLIVIGLWMIYGGEGHTQRLGLTMISGALQFISILTALILAAICVTCFFAIFLCTSEQNYDSISGSLLILSVGLLIALPVTVLFLHKIRRIVVTSRSVLLRSRSSVEVPIFPMVIFLLGAFGILYAAFHVSTADMFLSELRTMVGAVISDPYYTLFSWMTGISWSGMTIPFVLLAAAFLYTFAALICYRIWLNRAKTELRAAAEAERARKLRISDSAEAK